MNLSRLIKSFSEVAKVENIPIRVAGKKLPNTVIDPLEHRLRLLAKNHPQTAYNLSGGVNIFSDDKTWLEWAQKQGSNAGGNALGLAVPHSRSIGLSYAGILRQPRAILKTQGDTLYDVKGLLHENPLAEVLTHEFGHHLDFTFGRLLNREYTGASNMGAIMERHLTPELKEIAQSANIENYHRSKAQGLLTKLAEHEPGDIEDATAYLMHSSYAGKNTLESFAETFTRSYQPDFTGSEFAGEIVADVQSLVNRLDFGEPIPSELYEPRKRIRRTQLKAARTPDKTMLAQPRHSSARSGLPVRSSATGRIRHI
jgi:hypothetical protein